ncbi:MAG TPA: c-type cytochrome [Anaerolineae bacterium]|nr:c-type cytochrome [Anaerolineae bacterium]
MLRKAWYVMAVVMIMLGLMTSVASADAGDAARGQHLWQDVKLCKNCHGANGEGAYAGPRAGDGKSADDWLKQVRTPRANMPHFNDVQVSNQEVADMWTYMQTLPAPASFTPKQFPLSANASAGEQLVAQKRCVACHGDYSATLKFRFVAQGRTTIDTATVLKQLRTPAQNMPAFSAEQVSEEQAAQIAAYLQTRLDAVAAAGAAASAPNTLPVSGGESPASSLPLTLVLIGVAMLGAGALAKSKRAA